MAKIFDKNLEKATDNTVLEPNWDAILDCVDMIRAGELSAKHAVTSIRKKLKLENPHSVLHALLVLDACVKNCGTKVHNEVATREFMEEFKNLVAESRSQPVKDKALEMLQCWAMAFSQKPEYKIIVDTHNLMKLSGFDFPSLKDSDAMYISQVAPDWVDGDECFRCRTAFGLITRKHHCRACGQIFCDKCSGKAMILPHLGIEKSVRVCDSCYENGPRKKEEGQPKEANNEKADKEKALREKEEEELQLALAISQSEAEAKEQDRQRSLYSMYNGDNNDAASQGSVAPSEIGYKGAATPSEPELDDPLARYLNRDYWQRKKQENTMVQSKVEEWADTAVSAPPPSDTSIASSVGTIDTLIPENPPPFDDPHTQDDASFCQKLREEVTTMSNRIRSNTGRGRSIVNDTAIQFLFTKLTEAHALVLARMAKLDEERAHWEQLQDHLGHIGVARQAIDALREEHRRRERERAELQQREKQTQMQMMLADMRHKKHEMIVYQRHIALQRFQQQEAELAARRFPPQAIPNGYPPQQYTPQQYPQDNDQQHMGYAPPPYVYGAPSGVPPQPAQPLPPGAPTGPLPNIQPMPPSQGLLQGVPPGHHIPQQLPPQHAPQHASQPMPPYSVSYSGYNPAVPGPPPAAPPPPAEAPKEEMLISFD